MTQPLPPHRLDEVLGAEVKTEVAVVGRDAARASFDLAAADAEQNETLSLYEEAARILKRRIEAGGLRIGLRTETSEEVLRDTLLRETVDVERVPIDRVVDRAPEVRVEGEVTIIPIVEEVAFVEKRLVLREELHVRRRAVSEAIERPVTLRRQRVDVERLDASDRPVAATEGAS